MESNNLPTLEDCTVESSTSASVRISVVVPCYNEFAGLPTLIERASDATRKVFGDSFEIVLIDDGSSDGTWQLMQQFASGSPNIVAIKLARNHGHQLALTAGLTFARGDLVFVIDADLQDPPELLRPMLEVMEAEQADVVFGVRRKRKGETIFKKLSASLFYRTLAQNADIKIPLDAGDFRLMTRRVSKTLAQMPERDRFIRGMVAWIGLRQVPFEYDRDERFAGETKYPLKKMLRLAGDAFMGFSMLPLRFAAQFSAVMFLLLLAILVYALVSWLFFDTLSGWTSLMILISFSSAVQFLVLGIMGEYIGRSYLSIKQRPLFIVDRVEGAAAKRVSELQRSSSERESDGLWI
jgi:polyisoprenyl-phosphate glycosyltransferase